MIRYTRFSHINIVVDDIEKATTFYCDTLMAQPTVEFPHFKNNNFARSAGFLENPENVDVSIRFLELPTEEKITLELMEYHTPSGNSDITFKKTNDMGGPRHIALGVSNIDEAFKYVKGMPGVRMINESPDYKPFQIDPVTDEEFSFFSDEIEDDHEVRLAVRNMVRQIRYFYFIDPYGIQWEFQQKPA